MRIWGLGWAGGGGAFCTLHFEKRLARKPYRNVLLLFGLIRHRAFRHRWSALMLKSCFWRNLLSCLEGPPLPRVACGRIHPQLPQTLFRLFFLMSENQAHKLQNRSLGDPKIIKKTRKMRSGMECGKDWKKTLKNRSPGTSEGLQKNYFDLAPKNSRNGVENKLKNA